MPAFVIPVFNFPHVRIAGPYLPVKQKCQWGIVELIDARYRLVLKDTDISSRRTKIRYQYRYQSYRFLKSISIQIPILTIFKKDINTNTNTDNIQKGYQYQYQYLIFSKTISIPIPHIFKSTNIAAVPALPEKHVWHLAKHVFGNCGGAY